MLGCEEEDLGRGLPPAKFFSNKAIERLFNLLEYLFTQARGWYSCVLGHEGTINKNLFVIYISTKEPAYARPSVVSITTSNLI